MTIRIGFVGLRNIGRGHARRLQAMPNVQFAAFCDRDTGRLAECREEFGDVPCFTDFDEMLARVPMDGLVIAVPNHLHVPMGVKAMEAGLHIYVEKPLAHTSEAARELIEARERTGKLALLGMNQRLRRRLLTAARMLGEGVIGRIYYAKAWWLRQSPSPEMLIARKEWGMSRQLSGGGPLMDIGVHVLDRVLACLDFPEISGVSAGLSTGIGKDIAHSYNLDYEVEDFVCGLIHCADGCRIHLEASFFHAFDGKETQGIMIHGENGYFDGENIFQRKPGSAEYHPVPLSPDETYPQSAEEHFVHILSGEAEPLATLEQGLAELQLIEALYRSADRNGQFEPLSS